MTQKLKTDLRDKIATAIAIAIGQVANPRSDEFSYTLADVVLRTYPPLPSETPVHAQFEVVSGSITGRAPVPVKRVEMQDDGSVTVTIDYWPEPKLVAPAGCKYLKGPDEAVLGDKRMSELTPEQQDDATELWLRRNIDHFRHDTHRHISFLLERLAGARAEAIQAIEAASNQSNLDSMVQTQNAQVELIAELRETIRNKDATIQGLNMTKSQLHRDLEALRKSCDWVLDEDVSDIDPSGTCAEVAERLVRYLKGEVGRLNDEVIEERRESAQIKKAFEELQDSTHRDDPELDATDNAHPAFWRGSNYAVSVLCKDIESILTGLDTGEGIANDPWESVRRKLIKLVEDHDKLHDKVAPSVGNEISLGVPAMTCLLGQNLDMIGVWECFKKDNPRNSNAFDAMCYGIEWVRKQEASKPATPLLHPKVTVVMENAWADLQRGRVKVDTLREAVDFGVRFALQGIYPIAGRIEGWSVSMKEQMIRHYLPGMAVNFPVLLNEVDAQRMAIGFYEPRKLMVVAYDITEAK